MGLMYIAATLKQAGHEPGLHDCVRDCNDLHILKQKISDWKPDFIGISAIATEIDLTRKIMDLIRTTLPDIPVIFGGSWPSADPEKAILTFGADFVIQGEGELVFPELINALERGLPTDNIPGTVSIVDGNIKVNPQPPLTEEQLNALPFPAWELLDDKLYSKMPSMAGVGSRRYMSVVTSRGCPFKCSYCHQTLGKVFRKRSAESVLAEMEELRFKHGFNEFEIIDDCFNLDRERMFSILSGIRERLGKVKLHFPNGLRSDRLEPEDMAVFKQAGTVSAGFAIETASPRLQQMIHKNLNIGKAVHAINAAVKAGIYSTGFFMIGFPTETYEEALDTVEFATRTRLHRAYFSFTIPFAGTEVAEMAADKLKCTNSDFNPRDLNYFSTTINISAMSDSDLQKVFRLAYRRFYLKPARIVRLAISHPQARSLPKYGLITLIKTFPRWRNRK